MFVIPSRRSSDRPQPRRSTLRRAGAITATTMALGVVSLAAAGAADAHVSANAPTLTQGGYGVVTFVVPNESDTAATTSVTVKLPNLKSARPEAMSGWRATVTKDAADTATSITWTALPGTPAVPVGEFAQFRISGGPFPEQETVSLPVTQVYADGETVDWAQPENADGSEPDHPAPSVTLPAATGDGHQGTAHSNATSTPATPSAVSSTDNAARWLGGLGLLVGAVGVLIGVAGLRRRTVTDLTGSGTSNGGDDA